MRDAAQARGAQAALARHRFAEAVGDVVIRRIEAVERDAVAALLPLEPHRVLERGHLVAGLAMMERDQLAGGVEAGAQIVRGQRIEAPVMDVVLARPHHLDGLLHGVRQHHRVVDVFLVAVAAPAEAAAHQHVVIGDLVRLYAQRIGRDGHGDRLRLHAAPELAGVAVGRHRSDRVQRLHLGVIDEIVAVLAFDDRRRRLQRGRRIALLAPQLGRLGHVARRRGKGDQRLVAVEAPRLAGTGPGDR